MNIRTIRITASGRWGSTSVLMAAVWWIAIGGACADERKPPHHFQPVNRLLEEHVEQGQIAGAVSLVMQEGKVAYSSAVGLRDHDAGAPMTADTIFRIASMTKPVTSVAVLMLVEEGRLSLSDPLSKFVPEFATSQVLETNSGGPAELRGARSEITIRHLLTHMSGITYGFLGGPEIRRHFEIAQVSNGLIETPGTAADNVRRLATVPLVHQPGQAWQYGLSTDVLGRVVEVVSGQTLDAFFRERIFEPLGMRDTHFALPSSKLGRLAALYRPVKGGTIERVGEGPQHINGLAYSATYPCHESGAYHSGGAGLVSTAADYARFLQMLLGGGELDAVRLLKAETVARMTRNQIGELSIPFAIHGDKFGFGVGIHTADSPQRHGASVGTYSWGGIFNTYFWVDPRQKVVGVLMTQLYPFDHLPLWAGFQESVYAVLGGASNQQSWRGGPPGVVDREYVLHNGRDGQFLPRHSGAAMPISGCSLVQNTILEVLARR